MAYNRSFPEACRVIVSQPTPGAAAYMKLDLHTSASRGLPSWWGRLLAVALVLFSLQATGCPETGQPGPPIEQLYPEVQLSQATLEFTDIRVGTYYFKTITIANAGRANLELEDFRVEDDSRGAFAQELDQSVIPPGGTATLRVTYTPPDEGTDVGKLLFTTNDPDHGTVTVDVSGNGTVPELKVSPDPVMFTGVEVGSEQTLDVEVANVGTGRLTLTSIQLGAAYTDRFTVTLPQNFQPGFQVDTNLALKIRITYHPTVGTGEGFDTGYLTIVSDDPRRSSYELQLLGSSEDAPTDRPPEVVIVSPDPEEDITSHYVGRPVVLEGHVGDDHTAADKLIVNWFSSIDGPVGSSIADASGNVSLIKADLSVGEHVISLFATDGGGQTGKAAVSLKIWNEDSDFDYYIAGYEPGAAETAYRYFTVDDNIEIFRIDGVTGNVVPCLVVKDDILNNLSPVICNAHIGDTLRIVLYDRYAERAGMDGLNLFFGEEKQRLMEPFWVDTGAKGTVCTSAPSKNAWYSEHDFPYTDDCMVMDVSVEVTIPLIPEAEGG